MASAHLSGQPGADLPGFPMGSCPPVCHTVRALSSSRAYLLATKSNFYRCLDKCQDIDLRDFAYALLKLLGSRRNAYRIRP